MSRALKMDENDWALTETLEKLPSAGAVEWEVYLPAGSTWTNAYTKKVYDGRQRVTVPAPIDIIPVMVRDGKGYEIYMD